MSPLISIIALLVGTLAIFSLVTYLFALLEGLKEEMPTK